MQLRLKPQTLTVIGDFLLLTGGYAIYLFWVNLSPYWAAPAAAGHVAVLVSLKLYRANLRFISLYVLRTLFLISLTAAVGAALFAFFAHERLHLETLALIAFQNAATLTHRLFWYFRLNPETFPFVSQDSNN